MKQDAGREVKGQEGREAGCKWPRRRGEVREGLRRCLTLPYHLVFLQVAPKLAPEGHVPLR